MTNKEIINFMYEKEEEVTKAIKQAMQTAEGYPQGYHVDVLLDTNEKEIFITGALSQNSMTQGQFEGTCVTIATCAAWTVGSDGYDYDFDENIKNEDEFEKLQEEFEKSDDYYTLFDYVTANYPEIIQKMDDDHRDYIISTFDEETSNKLDRFIERMKEEEKYQ